MDTRATINNIKDIIEKSMEISKCRKCECMKESLESIKSTISKNKQTNMVDLLDRVEKSLQKFENIEYA